MRWTSLAVLAALSLHVGASSAADIGNELLTPAAKQDSGLGALPPYREWKEPWVFAMPAESLDSGLGGLPPYSEWRDPWVFAMPAEKIDSGLGEIPRWGESARAMRRAQD